MGCPPRSKVLEHLGISKEQDDEMQNKYSKENSFVNHRGEVLSNIETASVLNQREYKKRIKNRNS